MPQFQNTSFLLGLSVLLPLVVLFIYVLRWKQKVKQQLGDERLIAQLTKNFATKKYNTKIVLVLLAIGLGIIALANLRNEITTNGSQSTGIDVMIALDVSKSMLSQDEKPTRLDKAKLFINQLTEQLNNNRVGLVVFAGQAYLQMPLTPDATATKMFVSNASPDLVSLQGTNISDALRLCDGSLDTKEKKSKAVVLITDGEDQDDKAIESVQQLADHGTTLYTIGVGSVQGSPILDPTTNEYKRDENGQTVISKLNSNLLNDLATKGNGSYQLLNSTTTNASNLVSQLNKLEKKPISNAGGTIEYQSYYPIFLAIAIVLLLVEVFIPERRKIKLA
jgi:Ca-activated chloride channel homolog